MECILIPKGKQEYNLEAEGSGVAASRFGISFENSRVHFLKGAIGVELLRENEQNAKKSIKMSEKEQILFNATQGSAVVYKLDNMNDELMKDVNTLIDREGHVDVMKRCDKLLNSGCEMTFVGYPIVENAGCRVFEENLDLISPRIGKIIEQILWNHFIDKDSRQDIKDVMQAIIEKNPCGLSRPEVKYPYIMKSFLYAAYCGMTASTVWDGTNQVNGGFIKVSADGEVLVHYALESDAFKSYLYEHCFLDFPSTSEGHGNYAKVYKENGEYFFRLNFQIKYR